MKFKNCLPLLLPFLAALVLCTLSHESLHAAVQPTKTISNAKGGGCFTRQELTSKATGILRAIYVREGQMVTPGTIIAELDSRLLKAGLKEAQSAVLNAEALEKLAQDTVKRFEKLKKGESVTEQQVVEAQIKLEQAKAGKMQAQAVNERLQAQLDDTTIRAEVNGRVKGLPTVLGMLVQTGQSLGRIEIEGAKCD